MKTLISLLYLAFRCGFVLTQNDVRMPPSITGTPPTHLIYRSDDRVELACKGNGVPRVVYEWKKNGFDLNPNQPNIEKGADGSIAINNAAASDEGFYQCFARNQYGTALSNTAHIQRAVLDSASGTPQTFPKTVVEGLPFHIQADPRKSFPKPTYGWEMASNTVDKNSVQLRPSRRIQIAENGDLHFAYALPEDGKIYKCTIYNPHLDVKAGGSYTNLTVTRNTGGLAPFNPTLVFASLEQTVAVIGGSATLRCFFSGYPEPTITWLGPRNTLPIGRYALNIFPTELVINNITDIDQGDYTCAGSNTEGRTTHVFQIRVEAAPKFQNMTDGPQNVNVTDGESVTFNCNAFAKPQAIIIWLQNGLPINTSHPPTRFAFNSDNRSLTIRDVCRDCVDRESKTDLMVIQCNASNVHGYAFAQGYLNVLQDIFNFVVQNAGPIVAWTITVVVGAIIVLLLSLIGLFLCFRRKRNSAINRRSKNINVPNSPNTYERVDYRSVGVPLDEIGNSERSLPRVRSSYDHTGYDTIDQVLEDMASREGEMPHQSAVSRQNSYESMDTPMIEAIKRGRAMMGESIKYDNMGYAIPLKEVANRSEMDENHVHSVTSEFGNNSENNSCSNDQSEAMNAYSDLSRRDVNSDLDLVPAEVNHYMDLCSKDEPPCLDMNMKKVNPYLTLVHKDVDPYSNTIDKEMESKLDVGVKDINPYLDMGKKDMDPHLEKSPGTTTKCEADYLVLKN